MKLLYENIIKKIMISVWNKMIILSYLKIYITKIKGLSEKLIFYNWF